MDDATKTILTIIVISVLIVVGWIAIAPRAGNYDQWDRENKAAEFCDNNPTDWSCQ